MASNKKIGKGKVKRRGCSIESAARYNSIGILVVSVDKQEVGGKSFVEGASDYVPLTSKGAGGIKCSKPSWLFNNFSQEEKRGGSVLVNRTDRVKLTELLGQWTRPISRVGIAMYSVLSNAFFSGEGRACCQSLRLEDLNRRRRVKKNKSRGRKGNGE